MRGIPRRWRKWPAPTLRLRLTLLYGGCFLVAGAALLAITYGLVADNSGNVKRTFRVQGRQLTVPRGAVSQIAALAPGVSVVAFGGAGASTTHGSVTLPGPGKFTQVPGSTLLKQSISVPPTAIFTGRSRGRALPRLPAGARSPSPQVVQRIIDQLYRANKTNQNSVDLVVRSANVKLAEQHSQALGALLTESGVALAIMAILSIGLGWLLAGRALRPLLAMNVRARQITEDTLHEGLAVDTRKDELGELAAAFDGLLGRLERAFGAQRRFVANASHELRTPITLQRALVEVTLADPAASNDELRRTCERVLAAGEQQERVIEALLALARGQAGVEDRKAVNLAMLTTDLLDAREAQTAGLALDAELAPALLAGDEALLERVVANLLDNAIVHNLKDGWISLETGCRGGHAFLRIANAGTVIPANRVQELFEPFRRLGDERTAGSDGLGLGLSIVQAVTIAHGGSVRATPRGGGGLELTLSFPAVDAPAPSAPAHPGSVLAAP